MIARARWVVRSVRQRFEATGLVLLYHRIAESPCDPHLLCVAPDHFAQHLEILHERCAVIPLQQLARALLDGNLPRRAVVITFDDGYADNLHNAKPLLARYGIPATVFVTSGQLGSGREFWWDELERLLLQPGTLPANLRLNVEGKVHEFNLGEVSTYSRADYLHLQDWNIERRDDPSPRHRLFRRLYHHLYSLSDEERRQMLDRLLVWAGAEPMARASHRTLTLDEAISLGRDDLIEVGAHTVTHPILAALPVAEQRNEIQQSKELLERALKRTVASFASPHGSATVETETILQDLGFACACSTNPETVRQGSERFRLPRVGVRDWDGETFDRWLRWWIDV